MKIRMEKVFEFDLDAERVRLRGCFKGEQLARQEAIVDVFEKREFKKCLELIEALPYDNEVECSEQEYICPAIQDFFWGCTMHDLKLVQEVVPWMY